MNHRINYLRHARQPGVDESYSDEFYTPEHIVAALGWFDLDPCAGPKRYATRCVRLPQDGLKVRWAGRVWMNPPYLHIGDWLERFVDHGNGVCLVNARCETRWFQRLAGGADGLLFLKGRVQFERPDKPNGHPPCGSCLVAYGSENATALRLSKLPGVFCATPKPVESEGP